MRLPRIALSRTAVSMRESSVRRGLLLCLMLSACSSDKVEIGGAPVVYVPPSAPTQDAVIAGLKAAASEAKLTAPLEVSTVRPTDHGPGRFFACLKGTMLPSPSPKAADSAREPSIFYQPPPSSSEPRVVYLSVFFNNDVYKGTRQSVIMEACEAQQFTPVDLSPPPAPPKSPPKRK
jgi:hypothetical protein